MKTSNKILLSSALALAVAGIGHANAAEKGKEKCYGVSKAGKNDCAAEGNNSCAGTSTINGDKAAFLAVPTGLCAKLNGGSMEPGKNEEKKDS